MTTATPTPTAPLPPAAVSALHRLEAAFSPVVAEQHRIERRLAGLTVGESTVVNGTPVTVIDLSAADRLAHEAASHVRVTPEIHRAVVRYGIRLETVARLTMLDARRMSPADYDLLAEAQAELTALHELLEQAGQLHLVAAS